MLRRSAWRRPGPGRWQYALQRTTIPSGAADSTRSAPLQLSSVTAQTRRSRFVTCFHKVEDFREGYFRCCTTHWHQHPLEASGATTYVRWTRTEMGSAGCHCLGVDWLGARNDARPTRARVGSLWSRCCGHTTSSNQGVGLIWSGETVFLLPLPTVQGCQRSEGGARSPLP